jgi:hypothetical protein
MPRAIEVGFMTVGRWLAATRAPLWGAKADTGRDCLLGCAHAGPSRRPMPARFRPRAGAGNGPVSGCAGCWRGYATRRTLERRAAAIGPRGQGANETGSPTKPLHDPIAPPERDPPDKPMRDPPGDPTFEPPQPLNEPTPNPPSDPFPEMPRVSEAAWSDDGTDIPGPRRYAQRSRPRPGTASSLSCLSAHCERPAF